MGNPISNEEWLAWGKNDPLFGVASWPGKEVNGAAAWTDEEFYALGASEFAGYLDTWKRYGLAEGGCVEIGCGAGRMSKQLAKIFESVAAVDISPDMIAYARAHVPATNIRWYVSQGDCLPLPDTSVSGAFSCHVFQHFATPDVANAYFAELARVMKPGGTLLVHLPLFRNHRSSRFAAASRALYAGYAAMISVRAALHRIKMRTGGKPYMHSLSLEENLLGRHLLGLGFSNVQFVAKMGRDEPLTMVLATR